MKDYFDKRKIKEAAELGIRVEQVEELWQQDREAEDELQRVCSAFVASQANRTAGQRKGAQRQQDAAQARADRFAAVFLSHYKTERARHSPKTAWGRAKGSAMVDTGVATEATARRYLTRAGLNQATVDAHL